MEFFILDFETRSFVDLKTAGADLYAQDASTEILCMCGQFVGGPQDGEHWEWDATERFPLDLKFALAHARDRGCLFAAVNARFDQLIWEYIAVPDWDAPPVPRDLWYCISAQCRVNALPANLADAARCLGVHHKKNAAGDVLIRKFSIPDKATGKFNEMTPTDRRNMTIYCRDDVLSSIDVLNSCRLMTQREHTDWLVNERINDNGVRIDRELAEVATTYADAEAAVIGEELRQLTGGVVTKHTQNQRIKQWLLPRLPDKALRLIEVYKDGKRKTSIAKDIRANILLRADAGELELDDACYNVIAALDDGNKSSVSKFKRMLERADPDDDRVRGAFMFAGASTLRYSSRGLQLHNMRRDCWSVPEAEEYRSLMIGGERLSEGAVMDTLSMLLRPTLIPAEGHVFVVNDWKAIENRALPWLSGDRRANKKLQVFIDGRDPYMEAATDAGLDDRQIGKVIELSLGYGGANGAFNAMAKNYGVYVPDHEVSRIVQRWRTANPWAVDFWRALEKAAIKAVRNPGQTYTAGKVSYVYLSDPAAYSHGTLLCTLPGDHYITYPQVKLERVESEYGVKTQLSAIKGNWKPAHGEEDWPRYRLWHGLLAENVTQAFCAALLRYVLRYQKNVVAHVHDEVVLEVRIAQAEERAAQLQEFMETPPSWAEGLPLQAEPVIVTRYGK